MKAENEFAAYLTGDRPSCEAAYLNSRLFPAINALAKKARRCARTQLWLTVGECIAALCLPLLALFPFAIPDAALKLALASLGVLIAAALFAQQILEELGEGLHAALFTQEEKPFLSLCLREDLAGDVEVLASRVKAEALLAGEEAPAREGKFVCDDLGGEVAFSASGKYRVTRLPVPMKCATCKPLFFDLYGDCVSYPDMAARAEKKSTGGLSWFKRWIWCVCWRVCFA